MCRFKVMCRFKLTIGRVESGRGVVVNYNAFDVEPACWCRWRHHWLVLLPSSVFSSVFFFFAVAAVVVVLLLCYFTLQFLWCGCVWVFYLGRETSIRCKPTGAGETMPSVLNLKSQQPSEVLSRKFELVQQGVIKVILDTLLQ